MEGGMKALIDYLFGRTQYIPQWNEKKAQEYLNRDRLPMHYAWVQQYMPSERELKWMRKARVRPEVWGHQDRETGTVRK